MAARAEAERQRREADAAKEREEREALAVVAKRSWEVAKGEAEANRQVEGARELQRQRTYARSSPLKAPSPLKRGGISSVRRSHPMPPPRRLPPLLPSTPEDEEEADDADEDSASADEVDAPLAVDVAVTYTDGEGQALAARVAAVHPGGEEDPTPYYTIVLDGGAERDAVLCGDAFRSALARLTSAQQQQRELLEVARAQITRDHPMLLQQSRQLLELLSSVTTEAEPAAPVVRWTEDNPPPPPPRPEEEARTVAPLIEF